MKYRLVKETRLNKPALWIIQKKCLWWWEFVDLFNRWEEARDVYDQLRIGRPYRIRKVVDEQTNE